MGEHEIAVREEQRLGNVALDVDVRGLRPELIRVLIAPDCHDQVERRVAEPFEERAEDVSAVVDHRSQGEVDGRALREAFTPFGEGLVAGLVERYGSEAVGASPPRNRSPRHALKASRLSVSRRLSSATPPAGSTPLNRGQAACVTSRSQFGGRPRRLTTGNGTGKVSRSCIVQR